MYYLITATSPTNFPKTAYTLATDSNWLGWVYDIPHLLTSSPRCFPNNHTDFTSFYDDCATTNTHYTFNYVLVKSIEDIPTNYPELFI